MILSPPKISKLAAGLLLTGLVASGANAQDAEEVQNQAEEAANQTEEAASEAGEAASQAAEDVQNSAEDVQDSAEDAANEASNAVEEAAEEVDEKRRKQMERRARQQKTLPKVGTLADDPKPEKFYSAIGAGKTLPEGVMRVRLPYQNVYGKDGFDEHRNRESQGFEVNIDAMALAAEYGLTDRISLAFVAPFILRSQAGLNANEIRRHNRRFRREFSRYAGAVQGLLQRQGLCSDTQDCMNKIYSDQYRIPVNQTVTLTTGETVLATTDAPVYRQIDNLLMRPIQPIDGETGLGDIQLGGLYNFYADNDISLSVGAGIRFPTGHFTEVARGQRVTGGGVTDLGLRFNFDYKPFNWMVVSVQHQVEQMIAAGERKKTSAIANDRLNEADPASAAAIAIGSDGEDNSQKFERYGLGHDGFLRLGFGLTDISKSLMPVGVGVNYRWFNGRETRRDGRAVDPFGWRFDEITHLRFVGFNISWDGLALKPLIPLSFNYEYERAIEGSNAIVAPTTNRFQIIGYYKF